jgi:hypothetical protein
MHDEQAPRRALGGEIVPEKPVGGSVPLARGPDGEETGGLVDHEDLMVLMHQAERSREDNLAVRSERHAIAGTHRRPRIADHAPVDVDAPVLEPLLEATPGGLGEERAQPVDQGHPAGAGGVTATRAASALRNPAQAELTG